MLYGLFLSTFMSHCSSDKRLQSAVSVWQQHPEPSTLSGSIDGSFYHGMRAALMRCACMPASVLVETMAAHVWALRKARRFSEASHVILDIHSVLKAGQGSRGRSLGGSEMSMGAEGGLESVGSWWRVEEAKLLWANDRPKLAGQLLEEVHQSLDPNKDAGAALLILRKFT